MTGRRIASTADVEAIESAPYAAFLPHASVFDAIDDASLRYESRTALTFIESASGAMPSRSWTHGTFTAAVRRAANLFHALAGDDEPRVAMLLPAIPEAYFALWGAEAAGIACPINYLLDVAHVVELIEASGANILVVLGPTAELDVWSRVAPLRARCPGLRHVVSVGAAPDAIEFTAACASHRGDVLAFDRTVGRDTRAALFHTGGTTGAPKLAQHTHGNQLHAAWSAARMYAMTEDDVILNGFPLFHVAGSMVYGLSALLSGGSVVLPTLLGMRNPAFVPRYWEAVAAHGVTILATVPTVISTLLTIDPGDASIASVRMLLTGGSPLPPELAAAFERRFGVPVRNILGMTECAGVIAIEPAAADRTPGSCGLRLPFTAVEAVDRDGSPCPPGATGVLRVRGPNVGPGYTDSRRNAGTFSDDGWLDTGDIGHVDADGRIFITGRAKDVIIRGGHNIEPGVIEDALMRHPDVVFAAAVGEPDEYAGELPVAFVALAPGSDADAAAILEFARPFIPERPAHPKRIDILPALPMTAIGKVYKPGLRLKAVVRVIGERLATAGLDDRVAVEGCDAASGLSLVFVPRDSGEVDHLDPQIRAIMAPFAISWAWQT